METHVQELVTRTRHIPEDPASASVRDVRVLTSAMRTHGPITKLAPELLLDDPLYVQRLHYAATPLISYPRLQALSYYIGHHNPDILHAYSFWYQPADVAARYAQKRRIPFFFHPVFYENEVRKKWFWQLYKNIVGRRTFAAADIVFVISPYE
ncbi:MAG: glycosyltransferase, partial [Acidobacteriota bacterium]